MLPVAVEVADRITDSEITPTLISLHTVKPLDDELLEKIFSEYQRIAVIEEHGLAGGAGSAILEWANARQLDSSKVSRFGAEDAFLTGYGDQKNARRRLGLEGELIVDRLKEQIQ